MLGSSTNARPWYHPRSILQSVLLRPRIYIATGAGLIAFLLLPRALSSSVRESLAWIIGSVTYIGFVARLMATSTTAQMASRAARQDNSRMVIIALIALAIASSFISIAGLMTEAKEAARHIKLMYLALACVTIITSWSLMQLVFTLHYAHEFYRLKLSGKTGAVEAPAGLLFPGEPTPDYWDFLYFATSIGATSQTSDVAIQSKIIRRLVTAHAVMSFFFNSAVLALTINLAAGVI
jgi:uncharacterized membrane protein